MGTKKFISREESEKGHRKRFVSKEHLEGTHNSIAQIRRKILANAFCFGKDRP